MLLAIASGFVPCRTKSDIFLFSPSIIVRLGPHWLTVGSLMSLNQPENIKDQALVALKEKDKLFIPGWLQDEIIASCLFCLEKKYYHVKYCGPTEAMTLSLSLLWEGDDLMKTRYMFVWYNPSNKLNNILIVDLHQQSYI